MATATLSSNPRSPLSNIVVLRSSDESYSIGLIPFFFCLFSRFYVYLFNVLLLLLYSEAGTMLSVLLLSHYVVNLFTTHTGNCFSSDHAMLPRTRFGCLFADSIFYNIPFHGIHV